VLALLVSGSGARITPAPSVAAMIRVVDRLMAQHHDLFFDCRGAEVPW
jgi:hypothetical protein